MEVFIQEGSNIQSTFNPSKKDNENFDTNKMDTSNPLDTTDDAIETILMEEDAIAARSAKPSQNQTANINVANANIIRIGSGVQQSRHAIAASVPKFNNVMVASNQNTSGNQMTTIHNPSTVLSANVQRPSSVLPANIPNKVLASNRVVLKGQPIQIFTHENPVPGLKTVVTKKPISSINLIPPNTVPIVTNNRIKTPTYLQNNITLSPVKGGGFKIPISPLKTLRNPVKLSFASTPNANPVTTISLRTSGTNTRLPAQGTTNFQFQTLVAPQPNRITIGNAPMSQNVNLQQQLQGGRVQCVRLVPTPNQQNAVNSGIPITNLMPPQTATATFPVKTAVIQQEPQQVQTFQATQPVQKPPPPAPVKTQRLIMPASTVQSGQQQQTTNLSPGSVLPSGKFGYAMLPAKYVEELKKQLNNQMFQVIKSDSASQPIADTANPPPAPKVVVNGKVRKPCNCTKSMCLKLYCECFANGHFCNDCNCINCRNNIEYDSDRSKAIKSCLERNPSAFKPKIGRGGDDSRTHQKGCNCKRSGCLKNYCECYEARIPCTSRCKCIGCKNIEDEAQGSSDQHSLMNLADAAAVRCQQQAAARSRISSQMKPLRPKQPQMSNERMPCMFFTQEVIEATCTCLLAQAEEAEKTNRSIQVAETMILEEFGRCLMQIIQAAGKTNASSQS